MAFWLFPQGFLLLGRECGTREALRLKGGGVSPEATSARACGIAPDRTSNCRESDFHNPRFCCVGKWANHKPSSINPHPPRRLAACGCGACLVGAGALVSPGAANALTQIKVRSTVTEEIELVTSEPCTQCIERKAKPYTLKWGRPRY